MKVMKGGKTVGPEDIPVEWRCLGERPLTGLFNGTLQRKQMSEEWRTALVPIF